LPLNLHSSLTIESVCVYMLSQSRRARMLAPLWQDREASKPFSHPHKGSHTLCPESVLHLLCYTLLIPFVLQRADKEILAGIATVITSDSSLTPSISIQSINHPIEKALEHTQECPQRPLVLPLIPTSFTSVGTIPLPVNPVILSQNPSVVELCDTSITFSDKDTAE